MINKITSNKALSNSILLHVESVFGYKFKDAGLVELALTHPCAVAESHERNYNYQRLEFLGDRVISLVISELLYHKYPSCSEGVLSAMHAHLVSGKTGAAIGLRLRLNSCILSADEGLKISNKLVVNVLESIEGALYLDAGFEQTRQSVVTIWQSEIAGLTEDAARNFKSLLQEYTQEKFKTLPTYNVISQTGSNHAPFFTVEVRINDQNLEPQLGIGSTKKEAQLNAARAMYMALMHKT